MIRAALRYGVTLVVMAACPWASLEGQSTPPDRLVFSLRVEPTGTAAPGAAWTTEWVRVGSDRAQTAGATTFRFGSAWGARVEGGIHRRLGSWLWLRGNVAAGVASISNQILALRVVSFGAAGLKAGPLRFGGQVQDVGVGSAGGTLLGGNLTWLLGRGIAVEATVGGPVRGHVGGYSTLIAKLDTGTGSAYLGWQWPGAAAWQDLTGTLEGTERLSGALLVGAQIVRSRTYGLGLRVSGGDDGIRPALTFITQVPLP